MQTRAGVEVDDEVGDVARGFGVVGIVALPDALNLQEEVLHHRVLFRIELHQPASDRCLAQLQVPADLDNAQVLRPDHLNNLQLEARVKDSPY